MSSASLQFLRHLVQRRWPVHVLLVGAYVLALISIAQGWYPTMWTYYAVAMLGLFRVDEGALISGRAAQLLPLSARERRRLLWVWVFVAPLAVLALGLLLAWSISLGSAEHAVARSALVALYLIAPFSFTLLAASMPQTRATGSARILGGLAFFIAAVADLSRAQPSPVFFGIASSLSVIGLAYPLWTRFITPSQPRRTHARTPAAIGYTGPTGLNAMIWSRVRASVPSMLVVAGFAIVLAAFSKPHRDAFGFTLMLLAAVLMSYIWLSNWRWLCHFRALRCLPLSSWNLTILTLAISVVPSTTVWLAQYVAVTLFLDIAPLSFASLIALIAVQLITVPVFLFSPGWLRLGWLAALLPTIFLAAQSLAVSIGIERWQPWIMAQPRVWLITFVGVLAACATSAIVWTYREITLGRHAYRVQTDDWSPPSWVWPE